MSDFNQIKYQTQYNKENYVEIRFRIRKDLYERICNYTKSSLNAVAKDLLITWYEKQEAEKYQNRFKKFGFTSDK